MKLSNLLRIVCLTFSTCAAETSPFVEIHQGKLRGFVNKDWKGRDYYSFLSIPYAEPPIGPLRFMIPKPPQKWEGIRDATQDMPMCLQKEWKGEIVGQEDCLYLNVHTPAISTKDLKSVMVFIHGGGYVEGNGRTDLFGAQFLMPEDVVLVTIHYRLGLFGFLNFENPNVGVFGNMGLKDQNMALRWVQKNIEKFGGDPNSVTIFGESAGAASVHMHMLSPMSQGLFHRVISQSGAALSPWTTNGQRNTGVLAGVTLGFKGKNEMDILPFLQKASIEDIFKVQDKVSIVVPIHEPFLTGPVVETIDDDIAFLPKDHKTLISSRNFQMVPFMVGYTDNEGIIFDLINLLKTGKLIELDLKFAVLYAFDAHDKKTKQEIVDKIKDFYYGCCGDDDRSKLHNLGTDAWLSWGIYRAVLAHREIGHKDLYMYKFAADTELNYFKRLHPVTAKYPGASHIDDLGYIFKTIHTPDIGPDSVEAETMQMVVKLWTNFAKHGNPTPDKDEFDVVWKPVKEGELNFMQIENNKLSPGVDPDAERMAFWDKLEEEYGSKKDVKHTEL